MSMATKQTLIKLVAQALPFHVMVVFKMHAGFHEDYMNMLRNFWWGEDENKTKHALGCTIFLDRSKVHGWHGF